MNNEKIDFLVRGIDSRQNAINEVLPALGDQPDDRLKIIKLLQLLGETSGELAFIRSQLLESKKPIRKFALLVR